MFPQHQRLTEKRVFDTLFRRGKWIRGKSFSLLFLASPQPTRIGFIVTKKIAKSAVTRNQIKRRVRASFLTAFKEAEFAPLLRYFNLVVVVHPPALRHDYQAFQQEAWSHLTHLKRTMKKV